MSLFSKSSTTQHNTTNLYDNSANAGTNSTAIASGATNIVGSTVLGDNATLYALDGDVALGAMDAVAYMGGVTAGAAAELGTKYADTSASLAKMAFESAQNLARLSYDENESARQAGTLAQQNASGLAERMADMVAESKKDPNNATLENVFKWGGLAIAAIAITWIVSRIFTGKSVTAQAPRKPSASRKPAKKDKR